MNSPVHLAADPLPVDREEAAKLRALLESEPLPMIVASIEAFQRDLPRMLVTHRGKWAAYHGHVRIGFGKTETELYERCFARGLTRDDFIVGFVEPGTFAEEEIEVAFRDV